MTPNQQQEEIGKAYVHAVAAACGFAVGQWSQDQGCIDVTISADRVLGQGPYSKPKVDLQLKATTQDVVNEEHVAWSLDITHYDKLRANARVPHLLVVLALPDDAQDSVTHTIDALIIRKCAYWVNMTGMPEVTGQASKTVHIPRAQVLSPEGLTQILTRVSEGATL
ncbi:DUF4365 domain-containing protein [Myxococcota bacterium]|nr:DUF4365 domain-containing protein [Myxococcota bacterium]